MNIEDRALSNINIYILYTHPTNKDKTKTIYDVKNGKVINDNYVKPYSWYAEKTIEFNSNYDGELYEYCDTKWKFLLMGGIDSDETPLYVKKGFNSIKIKLEKIGVQNGKLNTKSMIPKLSSRVVYKDAYNQKLFDYEINFKIKKITE